MLRSHTVFDHPDDGYISFDEAGTLDCEDPPLFGKSWITGRWREHEDGPMLPAISTHGFRSGNTGEASERSDENGESFIQDEPLSLGASRQPHSHAGKNNRFISEIR